MARAGREASPARASLIDHLAHVTPHKFGVDCTIMAEFDFRQENHLRRSASLSAAAGAPSGMDFV